LPAEIIFNRGYKAILHTTYFSRKAKFRLSVEILNCLKGLNLQSLALAPLPGDCKALFTHRHWQSTGTGDVAPEILKAISAPSDRRRGALNLRTR
jgi:hypothetical protein